MALDFDIMYVNGNTISLVDVLSRLMFGSEKIENQENAEDKMLH